jgi:hypothetical protein
LEKNYVVYNGTAGWLSGLLNIRKKVLTPAIGNDFLPSFNHLGLDKLYQACKHV